MTRHGKFEAVALLHRSAHTSVWSARPAGTSAAPNHCLKRVELSDGQLADRDPTAAQHLLVAAALQQAMADKSAGWAPVFELGSAGTDAFYVTRLYPRSAQAMIDGRARLASADVRTILLGVVDALIDLDASYGRPHANLKPTNVLVGDTVRAGQVVLTDPAAVVANVASLTKAPDPKAVGQLLYALVTLRPHSGARWPLAPSDAWRSLGSTGKQWFALCESLVNPFAEQTPDLEQLRGRISSITPTRRRLPRAVVAVPVLAAVAAGAFAGRRQLAPRVATLYAAVDRQVASLTKPTPKPTRAGKGALPPPFPPPLMAQRPFATTPTTAPAVASARRPLMMQPPAVAVAQTQPDLSATLAGLTAGPTDPPADPPRVRPVVDPAPVRPSAAPPATAPAAGNAAVVNRRVLAMVREWSPPDFRSDAAQAAFEDGRRQFVGTHETADAGTTAGQWEGVSTRLRLAGDAFPPVDVAATAGWPVAVADQVAARREQVLARAVAGAFDQTSIDPTPYRKLTDAVRRSVAAASVARKALAGGSVSVARSAVADYQTAVREVSATDPAVADALSNAAVDLNRLAAVDTATSRTQLEATADDEAAPLAVRTAAWTRAASVPADRPVDFPAAAADHARGGILAGLLHDQMAAAAAEHDVSAEADRRLADYFAHLRDQSATAAAATAAGDDRYADLLPSCPAWFRFDVALAAARRTSAAALRPGQRQTLLDLAAAAKVPAATDVIDVLRAGDRRATATLATAGPAAVGSWRLHAGSNRDRCTYDATAGTPLTLEFLRVHIPATDAAAGLDCYLSTTTVPVALLSHALANDPAAVTAARDLAGPAAGGLWRFTADAADPVSLDSGVYRRRFLVAPSDRLPAQSLTPPLALYVARRLGCRLPSAGEWRAAYDAARRSTDPTVKGFAVYGWKLRTAGNYTALLNNPARDGRPDAAAFAAAGDAVWTPAAVARLGGRVVGDPPAPPDGWPLATLETADGFGFRPVGGTDDYAGVFHDLVGNVGQLLLDVPATLAEQVDGRQGAAAVRAWFTPDRLSAVSIVGASAVSPPSVDPLTPRPADAAAYADVGVRLAFTDPAARPAEAWAALRRMPFATAP